MTGRDSVQSYFDGAPGACGHEIRRPKVVSGAARDCLGGRGGELVACVGSLRIKARTITCKLC